MIGAQYQPPTQQECDVEDTSTDDEAYDAGQGEAEGNEQHVVLVQVAQEP